MDIQKLSPKEVESVFGASFDALLDALRSIPKGHAVAVAEHERDALSDAVNQIGADQFRMSMLWSGHAIAIRTKAQRRQNLPDRIMEAITIDRSISHGVLCQRMRPASADEVAGAVTALLADGRIVKREECHKFTKKMTVKYGLGHKPA